MVQQLLFDDFFYLVTDVNKSKTINYLEKKEKEKGEEFISYLIKKQHIVPYTIFQCLIYYECDEYLEYLKSLFLKKEYERQLIDFLTIRNTQENDNPLVFSLIVGSQRVFYFFIEELEKRKIMLNTNDLAVFSTFPFLVYSVLIKGYFEVEKNDYLKKIFYENAFSETKNTDYFLFNLFTRDDDKIEFIYELYLKANRVKDFFKYSIFGIDFSYGCNEKALIKMLTERFNKIVLKDDLEFYYSVLVLLFSRKQTNILLESFKINQTLVDFDLVRLICSTLENEDFVIENEEINDMVNFFSYLAENEEYQSVLITTLNKLGKEYDKIKINEDKIQEEILRNKLNVLSKVLLN